VLFYRERELFSWAKLTRDTIIAGSAFAYSVWAIWGSGEEWLAKGFMLLLFGIPVFVWMKWRQKQEPVETWTDRDAALLRRASTPPPQPPATARRNGGRTRVGLGVD
jgi:basic amino acid/polyamine antiporter, APA family